MHAASIRQLGPSDLPLLAGMLDLFAEAFDDVPSYCGARPPDAYVRELLARDEFIALAAVDRDAVVGALAAYEMRKFEQERSEIYVYDLAVAEHRRRQGIATALIERLKAIASARGAWVIMIQADPEDAPAVALYSKLGTREDVLHFDIKVG